VVVTGAEGMEGVGVKIVESDTIVHAVYICVYGHFRCVLYLFWCRGLGARWWQQCEAGVHTVYMFFNASIVCVL
jgi:hypothetical protein